MGKKNTFVTILLIFIIVFLILTVGIVALKMYRYITGEEAIPEFITDFANANLEEKEEETTTNRISLTDIQNQSNSNKEELPIQSSTSNNRWFYNQLNNYSKIIYNELEKNKENMKTGTYQIEFGDKFTDVLRQENGDKLLGQYYQAAIEAFTYENPDVFYIDVTKLYINIETTSKFLTTKYNVFLNAKEGNYLAKGYNSKEDVDYKMQQVETVKNSIISNLQGYSNYEKIIRIHDYLVDNIEYETTISQNNIYNIYGALVEKECVCEGYAKAFRYLTNALGMDCIIVIGTATNNDGITENHAWNYIYLDDNWYAVDATWDDPILVGGGTLTSSSKYRYFLKGENTMNKNHVLSGFFTEGSQEFKYPQLSKQNYK